MRKVAQAASAGFVKNDDFNQFWPDENQKEEVTPSWGSTPLETRKRILEKLRNGTT